MALYGLFAISSVDNILKPYIMSRGSKQSFIVTFIGLLGGVAAFGFIGIFLGPTLLAVGLGLTQEILDQRRYCAIPKQAEEPDRAVLAAPVSAADPTVPAIAPRRQTREYTRQPLRPTSVGESIGPPIVPL